MSSKKGETGEIARGVKSDSNGVVFEQVFEGEGERRL